MFLGDQLRQIRRGCSPEIILEKLIPVFNVRFMKIGMANQAKNIDVCKIPYTSAE
jgi:uncharacterized membrane protein